MAILAGRIIPPQNILPASYRDVMMLRALRRQGIRIRWKGEKTIGRMSRNSNELDG